jgi:biopolymer transport protein ExbD
MSVEIGSSSPKSEPNVVPLCDVLLVLLIIFMVVTPSIQKGANVKLPETMNPTDQPEPGKALAVEIKGNGDVLIPQIKESTVIDDLSKIGEMITTWMEDRQQTERKVLLRADISVDYGRVVDVMNAIRDAQIEIIGLMTEKQTSAVKQ